ncbi:hypothetical protein ACFQJC_10205 [Haloferax namakaokahaiae]|uniref:Uncharacterized protein n=1 Tax=Haloferax namakaokahaiae TaxID=1748331 RepID=A0ABD5ZG00_9EURY
MSRRRDAGLAVAAAVPLAFAIAVLDSPVRPTAIAVGVVGTLLLEAVLQLDRDRVRTVWERRRVQATTLVAGALLVLLGVFLLGQQVLVAVFGGLVTYLCLLAVVCLRERASTR